MGADRKGWLGITDQCYVRQSRRHHEQTHEVPKEGRERIEYGRIINETEQGDGPGVARPPV